MRNYPGKFRFSNMENIREYTSGNVTVIWKPSLCMHSERCWRGLPEVFKPEEKPWIQPGETNSEKLIEQVGLCPSGALTYRMHGENKSSSPQSLRIKVSKDGPLLIKDTVFIELENGTSVKRWHSADVGPLPINPIAMGLIAGFNSKVRNTAALDQ